VQAISKLRKLTALLPAGEAVRSRPCAPQRGLVAAITAKKPPAKERGHLHSFPGQHCSFLHDARHGRPHNALHRLAKKASKAVCRGRISRTGEIARRRSFMRILRPTRITSGDSDGPRECNPRNRSLSLHPTMQDDVTLRRNLHFY